MRSYVMMFVTVAVLFGAFVLYTHLAAPPVRPATDDLIATAPTTSSSSTSSANQPTAAGAWVNLYDKDSVFYGRLRSATCTPRTDLLPDHIYHLTNPEAEFFQRHGQIAHLTAVKGDVRLGQQTQHSSFSGGPFQPPSSGVLEDVTVKLYPTAVARDADKPDLTFCTPIAQFDADTYSIVNVDQVDPKTGHVTPAEEVPVTMSGRDLDFKGTGMTLYWNDEAHELKSLLVTHGQQLTLKNTTDINAKTAGPAPASVLPAKIDKQPAQAASVIVESAPPKTDSAPPTASKAPAPPTPSAAPAATHPGAAHIFLATFTGNVRVVQSGKTLVDADTMDVTMARRNDAGDNTANPPTAPANSIAPASPAPSPAPSPADKEGLHQPAPQRARQPNPPVPAAPSTPTTPLTTSAEPIDVFWTGPMKIVPIPKPSTAAGDALKPGDAIVRFTGSPVQLHQPQMDATGQRARYSTATGAGRLVGDVGKPLEIKLLKPDGTVSGTAHGDRVDFSQAPAGDLVVFTGAGHADFSDPQKPADLLHAQWVKECDIHLPKGADSNGKEAIYIQQADLQGDALVTDASTVGLEKLHLTAADIAANFDHPNAGAVNVANPGKHDQSGQPAATLNKVIATGNALCIIRDGKSPDQNITTDKLTIETGKDTNGKPYPRFITAEGNVHAVQAQQGELWSRRMDATVAPSTAKAPALAAAANANAAANADATEQKFQLQTLLATGDVKAKSKTGAAVGDILKVDNHGDNALVTLVGNPQAIVSSVTDQSVLRGPKITWQQDTKGNVINVEGGVAADSVEANGTHNSARADHAVVDLIPKSDAPKASKTAVAAKANGQVDPMSNKQIKQITLLTNAQVISDLRAPDNSILHRRTLTGQEIDVFPQQQRLIVPGPGWMLLEDYTKPTTKPSTTAARAAAGQRVQARQGGGTKEADDSTGGRGTTSFIWTKQFTFDQIAGTAVFQGRASIIHQPDDPKSGPTRVNADQVSAEFEPKPADGSPKAAESTPKSTDPSDQNQLELKQVHAQGNVQITTFKNKNDSTADKIIDARRVDYDPSTEMLIATGTADDPVRISDSQGHMTARFQQAWIDTKTNQVKKMIDFQGETR